MDTGRSDGAKIAVVIITTKQHHIIFSTYPLRRYIITTTTMTIAPTVSPPESTQFDSAISFRVPTPTLRPTPKHIQTYG